MKIKSCEIKSFGKLCDKTINLDDGITVIRGKNESGKSTLSAFIKYVLYGYSGRGRDERGNEKLKYTPWSGKKSSGALILEDENHEIFRAERSGDAKEPNGVILSSHGSRCFEGMNAGEAFYGIDASAFSKSSFVGQDDIEPDDMKNLGASLEKLILKSDSDDADFDKAVKNLGLERNKLYNKMRSTGKIFELSEHISELRKTRIQQSENNRLLNVSEFSMSETEKKLDEINKRLERLYSESENIEAYRAAELLSKLEAAENKFRSSESDYSDTVKKHTVNGFVPDRKFLDELTRAYSEYMSAVPEYVSAEKELEALNDEYEQVREKIHTGNNFDDDIDTSTEKVSSVLKEAVQLSHSVKKLKKTAVILLCLVVTIPVAAIAFVLYNKKSKALSKLLSEYGFDSISEFERYWDEYKELYHSLEQIRNSIAVKKNTAEEMRIRCASREEILYLRLLETGFVQKIEDVAEKSSEIGETLIPEMSIAVSEIQESYAVYLRDKDAYEAIASVSDVNMLLSLAQKKQPEEPKRSKEEVDIAIKYDEGARTLLSKKLSDLKAEVARLGAIVTDPAEIEDEIFRLESELSRAQLENDAIELAMEIMEKARDDIRGNAFPEISERAGDLFSEFTGGKYRGLFFDKDFAVKVLEENDTETRRIGYLSSGAIDTAYIALRVALAEYLCKKKPTLVFDDSFARIDDSRLANILDVLVKLSKEYQIIILSCHDREEKMLQGKCRAVVLEDE